MVVTKNPEGRRWGKELRKKLGPPTLPRGTSKKPEQSWGPRACPAAREYTQLNIKDKQEPRILMVTPEQQDEAQC